MKSLFLFLLISLIMFSSLFSQEHKIAIAVYNLKAQGISDVDANIISERLTAELQKTNIYDMMERELMNEILKEQAIQLSGLCSEASCLVEIGRLVAVRRIVGGIVGKIGNLYTLLLKMVDVETGQVIRTVNQDYQGDIEIFLTKTIKEAAYKIAGLSEVNDQNKIIGDCDLYIESEPGGSLIYIDNEPTGKTTPSVLIGLTSGTHKIFLQKGDVSAEKNVFLESGTLKKEKLFLEQSKRQIRIITIPSKAKIFFNKEYIGDSPLLYEVPHKMNQAKLNIQKDEYISIDENIVFSDNYSERIIKRLEKAAKLIVTTHPINARVLYNGKLIGTTPLRTNQIPYGKCKLQLSLQYYQDYITELEFSDSLKSKILTKRLLKKKVGLNITAYPPDSKISLDGRKLSNESLIDYRIDAGIYDLKIERNGYHQFTKLVSLDKFNENFTNIVLKKKDKIDSFLYSLFIPGAGQFYSGQVLKGFLFFGSISGGIYLSYIDYKDYLKLEDNYELYNLKNEINLSVKNKLKKKKDELYLKVGLTATLWVLHQLDNVFLFPEYDKISLDSEYPGRISLKYQL